MDYSILVNKDNSLAKTYIPNNLVITNSKYKSNIMLEENTYKQFLELQKEAQRYGYLIDIMSGYRDYDYQVKIYNNLLKEKGFNYTFRSVAKPGCSEHQTGFAIDICVYEDDKCLIEHEIEELSATKWVHQNAYKYGFILRYPQDKEEITKYNYEPWHLRYVGSLALVLHNSDKTLEEYYEKEH